MNFRQISNLVFLLFLLLLAQLPESTYSQEPLLDLPVQLIGFPVIILSVRLSNFAKKLSYSLNPGSYRERSKRSTNYNNGLMDVSVAEKAILKELGPNVCIIEDECKIHATRSGQRGSQPNWNEILRSYKDQLNGMKQSYLLSVFLGDVIRDITLCKDLSKRFPCQRHKIYTKEIRGLSQLHNTRIN